MGPGWRSVFVVGLVALSACTSRPAVSGVDYGGTIVLYGESHGNPNILHKELALWQDHYRAGTRHLFIEMPYYTAEFLNQWMHEGDDTLLDALYQDLEGTAAHTPYTLEFYRGVKATCPLTVFHGTDLGHQYQSTGQRFLDGLRQNGLGDSPQYRTADQAVHQGERYYRDGDEVYRENTMTTNFERELAAVGNADVVGIYGAAHTSLDGLNYTQKVPCMAHQLRDVYGDHIRSVDLSDLAKAIAPLRVDTFTVAGRTYRAGYYGKQDMAWSRDFDYREFWILTDAYPDFRSAPRTGEVLPYDNYPMELQIHQVYRVQYTKTDGTSTVTYYRSDGKVWEGLDSTEAFRLP